MRKEQISQVMQELARRSVKKRKEKAGSLKEYRKQMSEMSKKRWANQAVDK